MAVNLLTTDGKFNEQPVSVRDVNSNCQIITGNGVQLSRRQCSQELAKMYTPGELRLPNPVLTGFFFFISRNANYSSLSCVAFVYADWDVLFPAKRMQERACVTVCLLLIVVDAFFIFLYLRRDNFWNVLIGAFFGALCADFGSGLVHWVMDTWGSVDFPIIGQVLQRSVIIVRFPSSKLAHITSFHLRQWQLHFKFFLEFFQHSLIFDEFFFLRS